MVEPKKVVVVGLGEVGRPMLELVSKHHQAFGVDVSPPAEVVDGVDVLHICYPFQVGHFIGETPRYIELFKPKLTIINTTVAVGTTRAVAKRTGAAVVNSPVRGKHARMLEDLVGYTKLVGAMDPVAAERAAEHFQSLGMKTRILSCPEATELAKLTETTYFGLMIAWAQEVERYCDQLGQDYGEIISFYEEIKFFPPVKYFPGVIGGHCVMPNIELLSRLRRSEILQAVQSSNSKKIEREARMGKTEAANKDEIMPGRRPSVERAASPSCAHLAAENDTNPRCSLPPWVLITPARNEEAFIEKTIGSVIKQTALPVKWVIVDDGSTDSTAAIVRQYLAWYPWIEMVQMPQRRDRSFAFKVDAFNAGYEGVKKLDYEIVGNLDADVSFDDADYFEFILSKFMEDTNLGVAGTVFKEDGYSSEKHSFEGRNHVSGGCQLFRRGCLEEIGGFIPNKVGGVDWIAVTTARMRGWKTRSFRDKSFFHHRHLGTAGRSSVAAAFYYGEKDYHFGGHPVWELFRVAYRMAKRPYLVGGLALGLGYGSAMLRRVQRPVSNELMTFHRKEQMRKLRAILKSLLSFKPVDSFNVVRD